MSLRALGAMMMFITLSSVMAAEAAQSKQKALSKAHSGMPHANAYRLGQRTELVWPKELRLYPTPFLAAGAVHFIANYKGKIFEILATQAKSKRVPLTREVERDWAMILGSSKENSADASCVHKAVTEHVCSRWVINRKEYHRIYWRGDSEVVSLKFSGNAMTKSEVKQLASLIKLTEKNKSTRMPATKKATKKQRRRK